MSLLGDAIGQALPELRVHAVSRMLSRCVVRRPTGTGTDGEGRPVPVFDPTPVYAGVCRVKAGGQRPARVGDGSVSVESDEVHLPWDAPAVLPGDVVDITRSDQAVLVGRRFRVDATHEGDDVTARRYPVTSVTGWGGL